MPRNMYNVHKQVVMVIQDWQNGTDGATTGISVHVLAGMGTSEDPTDPGIVYATDDVLVVDVPVQTTPPNGLAPAAAGVNQYATVFALKPENYPQHQKILVINNDATKDVVVTVWANE